MDFSVSQEMERNVAAFRSFLGQHLVPQLAGWYEAGSVPREFFSRLMRDGRLGGGGESQEKGGSSSLEQAFFLEELARISPGVAVAALVHISLGCQGLSLYGSGEQKSRLLMPALQGEILLCLGNTEPAAGSDVAGISSRAEKVDGGWLISGTKSYVTNGSLSELALITAVSDPEAPRNRRLSMFLVDLSSRGVSRTRLRKQVWIPSDLTRILLKDVFVGEEALVGTRGRGLHQVLEIFTHSRVAISALTVGTAAGAFDLALGHGVRRRAFGRRIVDFQAKTFEIADLYSKIEAARLALWKACWAKDTGREFRLEASLAKYLAVQAARETCAWAADLFGAASVLFDHPVHKFPMDAWGASLGEGTQDVQKLIIFREIMKKAEGAAGGEDGRVGSGS